MRKAKERLVYQNYDMDTYEDEAIEAVTDGEAEPLDEEGVWRVARWLADREWYIERDRLVNHLSNAIRLIAIGNVGRWDGNRDAANIFSTPEKTLASILKDCDFWKVWDENGHLFVESSHHDGTNIFEIKMLTEQGWEYYQRWNYGNDNRSEYAVMKRIATCSKYSHLPRFAETKYGCKRYEYEKEGK